MGGSAHRGVTAEKAAGGTSTPPPHQPLLLALLPDTHTHTHINACAGYVDTDMSRAASAGGPAMPGSITTEESVTSMLKILEDGRPIDGRFFSYTGEEVPW